MELFDCIHHRKQLILSHGIILLSLIKSLIGIIDNMGLLALPILYEIFKVKLIAAGVQLIPVKLQGRLLSDGEKTRSMLISQI